MAHLVELPNTGHAPNNAAVAKHLHEQAERIERSAVGVRTVVMVIEKTDGTMYRQTCGQPCDFARVIGLLTTHTVQSIMGAESEEVC